LAIKHSPQRPPDARGQDDHIRRSRTPRGDPVQARSGAGLKARNRGNRIFGLWIAEKLGLSGEAATDYAKEVVLADFEMPGDDDVLTKVKADLAAKSIEISDHVLTKHLLECCQIAAQQIRTE